MPHARTGEEWSERAERFEGSARAARRAAERSITRGAFALAASYQRDAAEDEAEAAACREAARIEAMGPA